MIFNAENAESSLVGAMLLLLASVIDVPPLAQSVHRHAIANPCFWGQIPCAPDALSNLPFVL